MNRSVFRAGLLALLTAAFCAVGSFAYAQGGQTLSGTVVDASGAVIPGADVAAKHVATGIVSNAVSNSEGLFSIPSLPIGTYTVTVSLQGFKTSVIQNVVLTAGAGANVKATMEIGGAFRAGDGLVVLGNRPDPDLGRLDHGQHQPDHQASADHAQRDGLRQPPARRLLA